MNRKYTNNNDIIFFRNLLIVLFQFHSFFFLLLVLLLNIVSSSSSTNGYYDYYPKRSVATMMVTRGGSSIHTNTNETSSSILTAVTTKNSATTTTTTRSNNVTSSETVVQPPILSTTSASSAAATTIISTPMSLSEKLFEVQSLRSQGKLLHDNGEFEEAAQLFGEAGRILSEDIVLVLHSNGSNSNSNLNNNPRVINTTTTTTTNTTTKTMKKREEEEFINEAATCYMHQALCQLKNNDVEECVQTLSSKVLGEEPKEDEDDEESKPTSSTLPTTTTISNNIVLRSRAYHRRAKAKYRLNDISGAISDAKYAAFLGDPHATTFYGKLLMRQQQQQQNNNTNNHATTITNTTTTTKVTSSLLSPSSSSSTSPADSLLSLLMNSNHNLYGSQQGKEGIDSSTSSVSNNDNLNVTSMIRNFGKQLLDDEETRTRLCTMVQTVGGNPSTVRYLATVAGVPPSTLSDSTVDQLCNLCRQVTPKNVQKVITLTKRSIRTIQFTSKVIKLITNNRHILVYLMLLLWIRKTVILDRRRTLY
jgi:hypothetical protein